MADISNKALSVLVGIAIVVSLFGLIISQKGAITSYAAITPEKASSQAWISALFTIVIILIAVNIYFYHQRNKAETDIPIVLEQNQAAGSVQENISNIQANEQQIKQSIKQPINEINDITKSPQDQRPTRYSYYIK